MVVPDDFDKAYAAGFIDGDGCVTVRRRTKENVLWSPSLQVMVGQRVRDPLDWLKDRWRGSIGVKVPSMFNWKVAGQEAASLLRDILPFLMGKYQRASYGIVLQEVVHPRSYALDVPYVESMRILGDAVTGTYSPHERKDLLPTDVAYAAGFFDAEGSLTLRQRSQGFPIIYLSASQKAPEILEWLKSRWGGTVKGRPPSGYGKEPTHEWYLYTKMARTFLRDIQPWLIVKKRLADICVAWDDLVSYHGHYTAEQRQEIRALLGTWAGKW